MRRVLLFCACVPERIIIAHPHPQHTQFRRLNNAPPKNLEIDKHSNFCGGIVKLCVSVCVNKVNGKTVAVQQQVNTTNPRMIVSPVLCMWRRPLRIRYAIFITAWF